MGNLTPVIQNMTNHEMFNTCEANGYVVNKEMVQVLCERLEDVTGQARMFNILAGNVVESNKKILAEMQEFMGD